MLTWQPTDCTTRVMTIEDIKAECAKLGVAPSRPNIPRVRRAVALFEGGAVEHLTNRTYAVRSQSDTQPDLHCEARLRHRL